MKRYIKSTSDMRKFQITFTGNGVPDVEKVVNAHNTDEAFKIAYSMNMRYQGYDNVWVSEIMEGQDAAPSQFGLEIEMTTDDTRCKSFFVVSDKIEYLFIDAYSAEEARKYYYDHLYGNWCNTKLQLDPNGYRKFGKVKRVYRTFGGFKDSQYDATK